MEPDAIPLDQAPDRVSDFTRAVANADPVGAVENLRKMTEMSMGDLPMTLIAIAIVVFAIAKLIESARPMAQPFVNLAADEMRRTADQDDPPGKL